MELSFLSFFLRVAILLWCFSIAAENRRDSGELYADISHSSETEDPVTENDKALEEEKKKEVTPQFTSLQDNEYSEAVRSLGGSVEEEKYESIEKSMWDDYDYFNPNNTGVRTVTNDTRPYLERITREGFRIMNSFQVMEETGKVIQYRMMLDNKTKSAALFKLDKKLSWYIHIKRIQNASYVDFREFAFTYGLLYPKNISLLFTSEEWYTLCGIIPKIHSKFVDLGILKNETFLLVQNADFVSREIKRMYKKYRIPKVFTPNKTDKLILYNVHHPEQE